jgi:hypothetical protein
MNWEWIQSKQSVKRFSDWHFQLPSEDYGPSLDLSQPSAWCSFWGQASWCLQLYQTFDASRNLVDRECQTGIPVRSLVIICFAVDRSEFRFEMFIWSEVEASLLFNYWSSAWEKGIPISLSNPDRRQLFLISFSSLSWRTHALEWCRCERSRIGDTDFQMATLSEALANR